MTTSRQRVRAALDHQPPDRAPFSWGLYPTPEMAAAMKNYLADRNLSWERLFAVTDDSYRISPAYIGPVCPTNTDPWGIVRKSISYGTGQYDEFTDFPLAGVTTVDEIAAYPWPDPDWYDYAQLPQAVRDANQDGERAGKLFIDMCGNPFEIYSWLTGFEETLTNLVLHPKVVHAALEEITHVFEARFIRAAGEVAGAVDICYFADDLGGQHGPLISRRMYRQVLMPYHQRLITHAKTCLPQARMMFHSDGSVFDLLPDLVEAGVEVLEAVQVDAARMEPERLKSAFGDKLSFHGGISVQSLLPHGTPEEVESECCRLVSILGRQGGYIAAPTHCIQVGTPPQNVMAMLRGVLGESAYQAALAAARANWDAGLGSDPTRI